MIIRGRVENGVVVLPEDVRLPEGQTVTVVVPRVPNGNSHSILDIEPVSLGGVISPLSSDDDILGEMLEGHP